MAMAMKINGRPWSDVLSVEGIASLPLHEAGRKEVNRC